MTYPFRFGNEASEIPIFHEGQDNVVFLNDYANEMQDVLVIEVLHDDRLT